MSDQDDPKKFPESQRTKAPRPSPLDVARLGEEGQALSDELQARLCSTMLGFAEARGLKVESDRFRAITFHTLLLTAAGAALAAEATEPEFLEAVRDVLNVTRDHLGWPED